MKKKTIHLGERALILLIVCTGLFVSGEICVRVYERATHQKPHNLVASFQKKNNYLFGQYGTPLYETSGGNVSILSVHNERYPLKKSAGTFRIVVFGGSTTHESHGMRTWGIHYPRVLEDLLNAAYPRRRFEVINVGKNGYSTAQSVVMLSLDALSWSPDLVIICQNINDLAAGYAPDFRPDYMHFYPAVDLGSVSLPNLVFQKSHFYWWLKGRFQELSIKYFVRWKPRRKSYGPQPPQDTQAVFRRNLETFAAVAGSRKIPVLMVTQPFYDGIWSEEAFIWFNERPSRSVYPLRGEVKAHHDRMNAIVKETAQRTQSGLADAALWFDGRKELFIDPVHYSREGIVEFARCVFEAVNSQYLSSDKDRRTGRSVL